ncbi:uncharacterized protein KD926_008648 [Aspergillus affinis]|uniref:uncharacterized protein n=1 Tax=Aspergillus affinis TaxID=1070780 RepID=UPI0022FEAEF4|nr:uncharacterized protein KD926_008648 [Aspergillus affinis]KAI9040085.1 hypothetical protein KD926_008648 [Aspergillus affinis]
MMVHPMRELLDEGGLTSKSRDRQFTTFLDLKQDYHHDFINQLREQVHKYGYDWSGLENSESERELCATSFVEEWGKMYWGTKTNREKYLLPESLNDPSLCVYPDRKDEIVKALAILLKRKAKSHIKSTRPSMEATVTPSVPNRPVQPSSAPQPLSQPTFRKEINAKRKMNDRRSQSPTLSDDEIRRPVTRKTTGHDLSIRPFRRIASPEEVISADRNKSKPQKTQDLVTTPLDTTRLDTNADIDTDMALMTHFLVSISNQQGLAPIWVPFKRFSSTKSFLSHMLSECTLQYWDSHKQALSDVQTENSPVVVAASVKFAWSDFEMRLRQGKDEDWKLIMAQLEKAWKESELSKDSNFYDRFKILLLHNGFNIDISDTIPDILTIQRIENYMHIRKQEVDGIIESASANTIIFCSCVLDDWVTG